MRVTTRTGRNTYVSTGGLEYGAFAICGFFIAVMVGVALLAVVFAWPELLVQWLAPKNVVLVALGWVGTVVWSLFLLGVILYGWLTSSEAGE